MKKINKEIRKIRRATRDIVKSYRDYGNPRKNIARANHMAAEKALEFVKYMYIDVSLHPEVELTYDGNIVIKYDDGENLLSFKFLPTQISISQNFLQETKWIYVNSIEDDLCKSIMLSKLFFNKIINRVCVFAKDFNPPTKEDLYCIELLLRQKDISSLMLFIKNDKKDEYNIFDIKQRIRLVHAMIKNYPNVYLGGCINNFSLTSINGKLQDNDYPKSIAISEEDLEWTIGMHSGENDKIEHCYVLQKHLNVQTITKKCQNAIKKNEYTIIDVNGGYPDVSYDEVIDRINNREKFQNLVPDFVYEEIVNTFDL